MSDDKENIDVRVTGPEEVNGVRVTGPDGTDYDPDNPDGWDELHPDENWIAYTDTNGVHRVPVWYYNTLGL